MILKYIFLKVPNVTILILGERESFGCYSKSSGVSPCIYISHIIYVTKRYEERFITTNKKRTEIISNSEYDKDGNRRCRILIFFFLDQHYFVDFIFPRSTLFCVSFIP